MNSPRSEKPGPRNPLSKHDINVLLVDDQAMIGEAVRRMLAPEPDIHFHYCGDAACAMQQARELGPTVILQDLVMPDIDGLMLVKFYRADPALRDTPLIVLSTKEEPATKAEAFALGANDYLVKLPDRIELIARIRHHSKGYINLLQRNEAYQALVASQQALAAELAEAAAYVQALLPAPLDQGPVRTSWRFVPSTQLGGDAFGYHWLDDENFGMFLLDVCGHGVGAALLSITAVNVLRSQSLGNTNFLEPGELLTALNEAFLMEKHNNMYFTIWYGVYNRTTRRLRYSSAGHPPALLISRSPAGLETSCLTTKGMVLGGMPGATFQSAECGVPPDSTLFLMSDGVYEITRPDGSLWTYTEFAQNITGSLTRQKPVIDELWKTVRALQGTGPLDDDFSILQLEFPADA